jgi:hypothetical protein
VAQAQRVLLLLVLAMMMAWPLSGLGKATSVNAPNGKPVLVAQKLYQAWRANGRAAARKVADPDAVDKLFGVKWRVMKFEGCQQRDEGGFECIYRDLKNDFSLAMIVEGGASLGGYNVASLSFSTEE